MLSGFSSVILLLAVAVLIVAGSAERLLAPQPIRYQEAIAVAVLGLVVNVVWARTLGHRTSTTNIRMGTVMRIIIPT